MRLKKKKFQIGGMTCVNCQNRIEKTLKHTEGVRKIAVSYRTGMAEMVFETDEISFGEIAKVIEKLDYEVFPEEQRQSDISRTISFLVIIIALYILLQEFGILNLLVPSQLADSNMGYGMLFVVGLITSVHCIAMCGGINLSQSLPRTGEENTGVRTFLPSVLYNLGRVLSYTAIGFLLGLIGMVLGGGSRGGVPFLLQGILKIIA